MTDRIQELPENGVEAVNVKYKDEVTGKNVSHQAHVRSGALKKEDSPKRGGGYDPNAKSMKSTKREEQN